MMCWWQSASAHLMQVVQRQVLDVEGSAGIMLGRHHVHKR